MFHIPSQYRNHEIHHLLVVVVETGEKTILGEEDGHGHGHGPERRTGS